MQQNHLFIWQAYAPWPKRSQIEQDLRLSRGGAALFNDETLCKHLAMRGGTVLHKALHGRPCFAKPSIVNGK